MDKKLFILVGAPGCGKSTWARSQAEHVKGEAIIISRDEIRFSMLKDGDDYFSKENEVFNEFIRKIQESLDDDTHSKIYIDATHVNRAGRSKVLNRLDLKGTTVVGVYFDIPLEVCLERNAGRTGRALVPESAIKRMYESLEYPFELDCVYDIKEDNNNEKYIFKLGSPF